LILPRARATGNPTKRALNSSASISTTRRHTRRSRVKGLAAAMIRCHDRPMDTTRDEPVEEGHDEATDGQKLEGVIQQVRGDVALGSVDDVRKMVQQRLEEAGLPASPNDVDAVVSAVGDGGSSA
jgi:hypothetical protein